MVTVVSEIGDYLQRAASGAPPLVRWKQWPWDGAQAALYWLRFAPAPPANVDARRPVPPADVRRLCDAMVEHFFIGTRAPTWSSHMLETALAAVAIATQHTPEPLLVAAWARLGARPLDRVTKNFCRALGVSVLVWKPKDRPWDLRWMLEDGNPAQLCLRYFTMAKRPELWTDELEAATLAVLELDAD